MCDQKITQTPLKSRLFKFKSHPHGVFGVWHLLRMHNMVAGRGFEPPDLRVMSPTSYQAALPRDIRFVGITPLYHKCGAGDRSRTGTILSYHGILSPGRLPIPPHRQLISPSVQIIISQIIVLVNPQFSIFFKNIFLFFDKLQFWRAIS